MNYFYAQEINESFERLYQSEHKIAKNDYVVVEGYNEAPVTAQVTEILSKHQALTRNRQPEPIIDVIDFKAWQDQRNKDLERSILLGKMEDKSKEIALLEKMEKFAGRDPEMAELLKAFKGEEQPPIDDDLK